MDTSMDIELVLAGEIRFDMSSFFKACGVNNDICHGSPQLSAVFRAGTEYYILFHG